MPLESTRCLSKNNTVLRNGGAVARIKVIALLSQKGGAGKSTMTMQLAGGLARMGRRVAVLDLDAQQTALRWAGSAPEGKPFPARVEGVT
ncbi:MAG: ParA family protein, partial [Proteobacteria bacterium]|nr:ParA family protein [Pseudomonadota bacterium]